ncbi:serine protease [Streptomyces sp. NPDC005931]|uniref:S1 family peptidase n=1 Tax=Streptomyces sp. NPDC005931 TaxID=3364737 RepID=UPI0036AAB951
MLTDRSGRTDETTVRELLALTARHVVRLHSGSSFLGTGFLVSADTVVTCAHVVRGRAGAPLGVIAEDVELTAVVVRAEPEDPGEEPVHAFPDLAELRLCEPLRHEGVWLDEKPPAPGEYVAVSGFSGRTLESGIQPDSLHLRVVGPSGRFVRLQDDQVVQGLSGSPVLSLRTGRICGVLKASRSEKAVLGGWLVPVDAVELCSPGLLGRNAAAHRPGTGWYDLVRGWRALRSALFGEVRDGGNTRTTPAQMLAHGAMPFVDRPELAHLQAWCLEAPDFLLRLLHAPGGSGKTRLAAELCRRLDEHGWLAGFVERDAFRDPVRRARWLDDLTSALDAGYSVLAVFDYAQARQDDICDLLAHVRRRAGGSSLRVLLLARSAEPLWQTLREQLEDLDIEDWALGGASVHRLASRLGGTEPGALAARAFDEFSRRLDCSWLPVPAELEERARAQRTVLGVLACALDAVLTLKQGDTWAEGDDPLVRVCRHETRGWHTTLTDRVGAHGPLSGRTGPLLSQGLLLVPTLARGRTGPELTTLLRRTHEAGFPGQAPLNWTAVHTCLRMLYPAEPDGVAPLEPDRIGEILIRRVLSEPESSGGDGGRAYVSAVLEVSGLPGARRTDAVLETLDALARARGCTATGRLADHPAHAVLDRVLGEVLAGDPALLPAFATVGGRVPHAEPLAEVMRPVAESCDLDILLRTEKCLPGHPGGLSVIGALVLGRLLAGPDANDGEDHLLTRLRRLVRYSRRLEETARQAEALDAAYEAVLLSRDLVRRSERHERDYAAALVNLSLMRRRTGETDAALELAAEAVVLNRRLLERAGAHDRQRLLDTAAALSTLALLRLDDHQYNGAAADAAEGVIRCEEAGASPRQQDVLLLCLEVLAQCRHRTGRIEPGLAASRQAVDLVRNLAERQPARYLARLPDVLQRHGLGLAGAGRSEEAYLALREAARRRALLVRHHPAGLQEQRRVLTVLVRLSEELDEMSHERSSWVQMLSAVDSSEASWERHADQ